MNPTVAGFYTKDVSDYVASYRLDHGPRLQVVIDRYGLKESLRGKRVLDLGGGLGFAGELLSGSDYWVIDGAEIQVEQRLCTGHWLKQDLDYDEFSLAIPFENKFDAAFCQEVLEHLSNPYHCLCETKKMVREGGEIFISLPTESVTHNTIYASLLWPPQNWELFLGQMALEIVDRWVYEPKARGWPAYQWRCINRPWSQKRLIFHKDEEKFINCTPLEATNL